MAEQAAKPSLETYQGNCHCGAFQFSVKLPELKQVVACNCSVCSKKGYLWAFPSSNDLFVVEKGEGTLKEYQFGNKTMTHRFCPTCGTSVMGERHMEGPTIGVNVRTLQAFNHDQLAIKPYDGAKLEPSYKAPDGPNPSATDSSKETYHGSCHCGKVTYSLQSEPLEEVAVKDCNCSICSRNAYLWVYPPKEAVVVEGEKDLECYRFGPKSGGHSFCSTCGVSILNALNDTNGETGLPNTLPINVRTINGIDLNGLKIEKIDGKNKWGEPYEFDAKKGDKSAT